MSMLYIVPFGSYESHQYPWCSILMILFPAKSAFLVGWKIPQFHYKILLFCASLLLAHALFWNHHQHHHYNHHHRWCIIIIEDTLSSSMMHHHHQRYLIIIYNASLSLMMHNHQGLSCLSSPAGPQSAALSHLEESQTSLSFEQSMHI